MPPQVQRGRHKHAGHAKPITVIMPALPTIPHPRAITHTAPPPLKQTLSPMGGPVGNTEFATGHVLGIPYGPVGPDIGPDLNPVPDAIAGGPTGLPGDIIGGILPDSLSNPLGGVTNSINQVGDVLSWLTDPVRILKVIGGGIFVIMGLWHLTKQMSGSNPAQHAGKAVGAAKKATEVATAALI